MHKLSIVEFLLIFSTAVNLIQTSPLALHNPEDQSWRSGPRYFVECASATNKAKDRSLGIKNLDPTPTVEPPNSSIAFGKSVETESDTLAPKNADAPPTPSGTIDEQVIENILTDFFDLVDGSVTSTNDKFKTNKRSVDVKTNDEKLEAESENQRRRDVPSILADALSPSARHEATETRKRAFTSLIPVAVYPHPTLARSISPFNPFFSHGSRSFGDPSHTQPKTFPFFWPFPQPIDHSRAAVNPEGRDIINAEPNETKVLSSARTEPVVTHHVKEIASKDLTKPDSEVAGRSELEDTSTVTTKLIKLAEKISIFQPLRGKSSDSYSGNEMARLPIAGDRKRTIPTIKPLFDIAGLKKKLPTPAKPLNPKLAELNQLIEKIKKLQAEMRASVRNKDRNKQSKLKS